MPDAQLRDLAADAIAAAVAPRLCVRPPGECEPALCSGCLHDAERAGRAALDAMSAAGLLIVKSERLAQMQDALRAADDWIREERANIVECHTVADANEWRDESTMDDLAQAIVAEIDTLLTRLRAAAGEAEPATAVKLREEAPRNA